MVYFGIILDDIILANIVLANRVSMHPHPVFLADTYPYQSTLGTAKKLTLECYY